MNMVKKSNFFKCEVELLQTVGTNRQRVITPVVVVAHNSKAALDVAMDAAQNIRFNELINARNDNDRHLTGVSVQPIEVVKCERVGEIFSQSLDVWVTA